VLEQGTVVGQVVVNASPLEETLKRTSAEGDPQQQEEEVVKKKLKLSTSEPKLVEGEMRSGEAGAGEPGRADKSLVLAVLKQAKLKQDHSLENR